jgi:hypothetical protein
VLWAVRRLKNLPMPRRLRALSSGGELEVTRVGPRSLRVGFLGGFFPTAFSRFFRSPNDRFSLGQHFELPGLSVVVDALDAQGDAKQVLYKFPVHLEGPSLRWMRLHDGAYVPWAPPPVGYTQKISAERGVF